MRYERREQGAWSNNWINKEVRIKEMKEIQWRWELCTYFRVCCLNSLPCIQRSLCYTHPAIVQSAVWDQQYEWLSIISGTGPTLLSKTNFGHTGHHHPRSSSLQRVCTVPSVSAVFNRILEVVFCEGVQHRLKNLRGPSQASRVGGERQSCCFLVKNSLVKRKVCEMVRFLDATLG
jgi:hypothetical protein